MRKIIVISIIFFAVLFSGFCEDIKIPGFGNQIILTNTNVTPSLYLKRTMGGQTKYKMTPGDTYQFTAQIDTTITIPIVLDDNYLLEIPFIGTMDVRGQYFSDVRNSIIKKIKAKGVPVQFVDFSLTSMALIDVFIYGGVENPGIATLTPINTFWDAILLAKGLKKGGSYRSIELVRQDKKTTIDIARYVREGDLTQNPYLEPGDKFYIPHAEIICQITGNIMYPDYYEMIPGETLYDLLKYSGGFLPGSYQENIEVARLGNDGMSITLEKASFSTAKTFKLKNGDRIRIKSANETKDILLIEAAVYGQLATGDELQVPPTKLVTAAIPYVSGITLLQLVDRLGGITPLADAEKSFVIRGDTKQKVFVDVRKLTAVRDPALDIKLMPDDHVFIPMKMLLISVGGEVVTPGAFPYQTGTKVMDYLKLAGGVKVDTADLGGIYTMDDAGRTTRISIDSEVTPGELIYVGKSMLNNASVGFEQIGTIVTVAAAILSLTVTIIDLASRLQ